MFITGRSLRTRFIVLQLTVTIGLLLPVNFASAARPVWVSPWFFSSASSLKSNPGSLFFGNVAIGLTKIIPVTLTNNGTSSVTLLSVTSSLQVFSLNGLTLPVTLAAHQTISVEVVFAPQTSGHVDGSFSFATSASTTPFSLGVHGNGMAMGAVSLNPATLSFGNLTVGATSTLPIALTNSGTAALSISQISVSGAGFSASSVGLPLHLAVGQSVSLALNFSPVLSGAASGTLSIISNASNPSLTVALSGSGASPGLLSASSAALSFGSVQSGSISSQSETITNSGGSPISISQANVTGAGFSLSGLTMPLSLAPGQSFTFGVAFVPASAGNQSGAIAVISNASNSNLTISLSGSGIAPSEQHSVSLAWQPSSSVVAGYNVYRGTQSGGPYGRLNSGPSPGTTYSDVSVETGGTYFYVTTAVNNNGTESGYSNQVQATIPGAGTAAAGILAAASSSLSFGNVQVGSSQAMPESLTNSGSSTVTISQASISGGGFSTTGLTLPLTLAPGQSFTFNALFTPTAAGNASGTLSVVSNASDSTFAISFAGTGTAAGSLAVAPAALAFGNVTLGQSKTLTATLTAGGSSVTISSAEAGIAEFALSGVSFPLTLAAGQSAALAVTFTPQVSGTTSDSISFLSNASDSPLTQALSGSGGSITHSVMLSWSDASTGIAGYNIYRASASSGPFSKINGVLDANPTYTDASVQAGQTYFYVATAVDESGTESSYSSTVEAIVPSP